MASYATSVWSDEGFVAESEGVGEGFVALRASEAGACGAPSRSPPARCPSEGSAEREAASRYQYTSFAGEAFPSGPLRVYLLNRSARPPPFCGHATEETVFNTLRRVAKLIYAGEAGYTHPAPGPTRAGQRRRCWKPSRGANPLAARRAIQHPAQPAHRAPARAQRRRANCSPTSAAPTCSRPVSAPLRLQRPHDRQLRALDPGRRGLQAPRGTAGGPAPC